MVTIVALAVVLLVAFSTTGIGRRLREVLVDQTARRLNGITPGRFAFYAALGAAGLILFGLFEAEGLRLFSLFTPELILWFGMFDVALFLDVFILAAALGATARFRAIGGALVQGVRQLRVSLRPRPASRSRATKPRPARIDKAGSIEPDPGRMAFA